jgi:hypothetical protein
VNACDEPATEEGDLDGPAQDPNIIVNFEVRTSKFEID